MGETDVVRGVQLSNITVLDPAERPREPSAPRTILNLLFGIVLGAVFGIGTAALLEHVDTSLKTPADVERILALPTLGVIPDFRRIGTTERLVAAGTATRQLPATRGQALAAEVFRTLRTSLLFFDPAQPPRTMLVTSARAGEGKTATAVNLALSLAQLGAKVVLVDADLRKPRCHHALGVPGGPGLAEVLLGEMDTLDAVRPASVRAEARNGHAAPKHGPNGAPNGPGNAARRGATLAFMPSGRLIADAAELLASPRMRVVLAALSATYDIVLVDSPPVFPVADTSLLGRLVDGVVLVVHGSRTPRHVTQEAIGRLRFMQSKVIGVVLNGVDPGASEYSYRYSHYFPDAAEA
jgi:Mrp family chromosome partitioning ATPase